MPSPWVVRESIQSIIHCMLVSGPARSHHATIAPSVTFPVLPTHRLHHRCLELCLIRYCRYQSPSPMEASNHIDDGFVGVAPEVASTGAVLRKLLPKITEQHRRPNCFCDSCFDAARALHFAPSVFRVSGNVLKIARMRRLLLLRCFK